MALYAFGKNARLRCRQDFQAVFDHTLFKVHQPHLLILATLSPHSEPLNSESISQSRLGLVVAKKKIRKAHERNRIKRLSRESFRLAQQQLNHLDIVILPKVNSDKVSNTELSQQLQQTWLKLSRLVAKHNKTKMDQTKNLISHSEYSNH